MIPKKSENPNGLHAKYAISKIVGYEKVITKHMGESKESIEPVLQEIDPGSEYFVMRLDLGGSDLEHIKACRIGIHAYADAIQHHLPQLAKDLKERYPLL